ncbi:MAG: hypothetical protein WAM53_20455, partial [Terrimicrobiaceae bacterium]
PYVCLCPKGIAKSIAWFLASGEPPQVVRDLDWNPWSRSSRFAGRQGRVASVMIGGGESQRAMVDSGAKSERSAFPGAKRQGCVTR